MAYALGVDLGTTFTAAAIGDSDGVRMADLTHDGVAVPSILTRTADGFAVGLEALAVAATQPWLVAREFKRRFGDETPFVIGEDRWSATELTTLLFDWLVRTVTAMEGEPPGRIVITHPATWQGHRLGLLDRATSGADAPRAFLAEPSAAAIHYHERARMALGDAIAVYDLGGGTFDATVVRRTVEGYEIVGRPSGIEHLGGLDFDQAIFDLVTDHLGPPFRELDPDDVDARRSVARLREECTRAKIALSFDARAVVPVVLPGLATEVVVTRTEFERRIEPLVLKSIETLTDTIRSGDLEPRQLTSVLLVGGSSRVPLVAGKLREMLGVQVVIDTHPKYAIAKGAVLSLSDPGPAPAAAVVHDHQPTTAAARDSEVEQSVMPEATVDISALMATIAAPRMIVVSGPNAGLAFDLPAGPTTVGRSTDRADIGLLDPAASRLHLRIDRTGRDLRLTDLGSTSGTRLGRRLIDGTTPLQSGDLFEMGSTWLLVDEPLRRPCAPGPVALNLTGEATALPPSVSPIGWTTLGFGGPDLSPVRIELAGGRTVITLPGLLGDDLLRSLAIELITLQPELPVALLRSDDSRGWSSLRSHLVHRGVDVPDSVRERGILLVASAGLGPNEVETVSQRPRGRAGVVLLQPSSGGSHAGSGSRPGDQVIGLDPVSASVLLLRARERVVVDVLATVSAAAVQRDAVSRRPRSP